jgi:hypothetical protein
MTKIFVIPDTQCRIEDSFEHLEAAGNYIAEKKPETIVHLGDHWDMPSLSSHNSKGHIVFEGARITEDMKAGINGMESLMSGLQTYNNKRKKHKMRKYNPRMIFCRGNHEDRLRRLFEQEPYLIGSLEDFPISQYGWEDHEFLKPVTVEGVTFCHYAQGGAMGKPISRAHLISQKKHGSWVVGHQQTLDIYFAPHLNVDGHRVQSIIAGAFYEHHEDYMRYQGNQHWRGCLMLTEVHDGQFDIMILSLDYLKEKWL